MRRLPLAVVVLACLVLLRPGAGGAQSPLPPCDASHNGKLIRPELTDSEQTYPSPVLYATHRLKARLFADAELDEPYGVSYEGQVGSEQLAPGSPGVVSRLAFIGDAPGPVSIPVIWTVTRVDPGVDYTPRPYCQGSETITATLRKPTPTSLAAALRVSDLTHQARVKILIGDRRSDDFSPITVRMRRGARGAAKELFTLPLANVRPRVGGYRFTERFAGVTLKTAPTDARFDGRGLLTLSVWMPRLGHHRHATRSFTIELVRDGRVLMRVRAVIACEGMIIGAPPALQDCSAPVWRVTRPAR
jgi:hypothetical protein